jgi:transposase InsO family protein
MYLLAQQGEKERAVEMMAFILETPIVKAWVEGYPWFRQLRTELEAGLPPGEFAAAWRSEGLKVPQKQPKRGRIWLNDGSVVRLRPLFPKHVCSYDFMEDRTHNGVKYRILNVIDEYTWECLAVKMARRLTSYDVVEVLTDLFIERGIPVHIRSDNGSEFTAIRVKRWLEKFQVRPLYIEPGSPWENGYIESFNGKMRDELQNLEIFYSLKEAQVLIEMRRKHYNTVRPHSVLGNRPPVPTAVLV